MVPGAFDPKQLKTGPSAECFCARSKPSACLSFHAQTRPLPQLPSCSLASYTDVFWPEAAFAVWRNLHLDSVFAFCKIIIPVTLIRTTDLHGEPRYATYCLAARAASNVADELALARVRSDLNGCSMRLDLTHRRAA